MTCPVSIIEDFNLLSGSLHFDESHNLWVMKSDHTSVCWKKIEEGLWVSKDSKTRLSVDQVAATCFIAFNVAFEKGMSDRQGYFIEILSEMSSFNLSPVKQGEVLEALVKAREKVDNLKVFLDDEKKSFNTLSVKQEIHKKIDLIFPLIQSYLSYFSRKICALYANKIIKNIENIVDQHLIIKDRVWRIEVSGHLCKKNRLSHLGYSVTRIGNRCFVHVPKSNFSCGQSTVISLALDIQNGDLVVYAKNKKIIKEEGSEVFKKAPILNPNDDLILKRCPQSPYLAMTYGVFKYVKNSGEEVFHKIQNLYVRGNAELNLKNGWVLTKEMLLAWALSGAEGIRCLHENMITHNDIKLENFLLSDDGNRLVLTDFGFAVDWLMIEGKAVNFKKGTLLTVAPERMNIDEMFSFEEHKRGDIYSFGCCLYFLLKRKDLPWQDEHPKISGLYSLTQEEINAKFPKPDDPLELLCWELLQRDPLKRPNINEVIDRLLILLRQ